MPDTTRAASRVDATSLERQHDRGLGFSRAPRIDVNRGPSHRREGSVPHPQAPPPTSTYRTTTTRVGGQHHASLEKQHPTSIASSSIGQPYAPQNRRNGVQNSTERFTKSAVHHGVARLASSVGQQPVGGRLQATVAIDSDDDDDDMPNFDLGIL